ncbi:MAG: protein kinase [Alphaproteobacteria bacterium]|nr:protein kinase [Alphaproteobacteria bacterium]MCB9794523.1 protein kinase [Alphaproteobacteria bacterium]
MWTIGQKVLDRYELLEPLGSGAGGETWLAEGPAGQAAVKLIQGEDARAARDLIREAVLLRELDHPHVVGYREFSDRPDEGCAILVTDFISGGDLEAWRALTGAPSLSELARLGLQLVSALEALGQLGVLHRDLKPANILVEESPEGPRLKVADFGISRRTRDGVALTQDRSLTPSYAAPEQYIGGELTPAADRFALGGVLYFLATGQAPRGVPLETGHPGLDALLPGLRHADPEQRMGLAELRAGLQSLAGEAQPIASSAPSSPKIPQPPSWVQAPTRPQSPTWAPDSSPQPAAPVASPGLPRGAIAAGLVLALALGLQAMTRGEAPPEPVTERAVEQPPPAEAPPAAAEEPAVTEVVAEAPAEVAPPAAAELAPVRPPPVEARPAPSAAQHSLFINSRPWSQVLVDGEPLGRTSDMGSSFTLPAGPHRVRLEAEGGLSWERSLDLQADTRLCVNLRTGVELGC